MSEMYDVAIVGAGPVGLAAAIACKRAGLSYVVLEKGCVVNAIFEYPTYMTFFTTSPRLEIGNHPFVTQRERPDRKEALHYYRLVAEREALHIEQYTEVTAVHPAPAGFTLAVNRKDGRLGLVEARRVIVATGYFDNPVLLGIPGEDSPNVSHYYTEAHPFWGLKVTVIGAGSSAADAALDLWRGGAHVTLVVRGAELKPTLKYWIRPDLENRIREGSIQAHFSSRVTAILEDRVVVEGPQGRWELPTDFTFALTGYRPQLSFLADLNLATQADQCLALSEHYETSIPGLFVVGSAGFAGRTNQVFIENGREHALLAVAEIERQLGALTEFPALPSPPR
ncbi:YpdA family putative bacillithiol disulfide reductase [Deinococcus geothermalis]|uniref:Thioredoxin reductase n=1 Tax=Deinococcus geothermalis (strain DSM 11300 / CIP 105573 / AG-3a) TaxID=319795 RepID=Q1IVW1_DEIGD|nr:YpdA family putative bacillithiol disulfide reductase [Deinococcus geothermalis]ABF46623.1 Thioredoxin reductase [Deinococcus geothermalis DSM 11300]